MSSFEVTDDQIRSALSQPGTTIRSVSDGLGVSFNRVQRLRREVPAAKIKCSCGLILDGRPGRRRLHERGTFHRRARRFKALFEQPCISLEQIGERLGLTKQRMHQLAHQMGLDVQTRRSVCMVRRAENRETKRVEKRVEKRFHPKLLERFKAAEVVVDELGRSNTFKHDDQLVYVYQLSALRSVNPKHHKHHALYAVLQRLPKEADLIIAYVIPKDACYIFPRAWCSNFGYIPFGRIEGYNNLKQRDWEQWRERWDLLGRLERSTR